MHVTLPEMGESVTEGTIAKWLKQPGDQVREGEGLVEVTTDKVDAEVPAPASGTLVKILAEAGKTVAVGAALAEIAVGTDGDGAAKKAAAATPASEKTPTVPSPASGSGDKAGMIPLRGAAAALVKYMEESLQVPTATSFRTVRVDVLDQRRRQLTQSVQAAGRPEKISYTHLVAFAITRAVRDVPSMAVTFDRLDGNPARVARGVHLGLAVDVQRQDGSRMLLVPVIRDADRLDFAAFRDQYETLVAKARTGKLVADELSGATIVLTNPGGIGTVSSVPRLMKGQGTIVATGAIGYPPELTAIAESGLRELGVSKVMTMTSTYDHRVIQGAESGEFLRRIDELLSGADGFYESVFESMKLVPPAGISEPARAAATAGEAVVAAPTTAEAEMLRAVAAGMALVAAYRSHGHLAARLDPLGSAPPGDPSLDPVNHGLTPQMMEAVPAAVLRVRVPGENLAEVLTHLRETYCSTIAYEIEHMSSHEQRNWLRERIESGRYRQPLSPERKLQLLGRLTKVEAMDRYLRRTFLGQKTFYIEGLDSMIVMLGGTLRFFPVKNTV